MEYPQSSDACLQLASELVEFLRKGLDQTSTRAEWTQRNFHLLDEFARIKNLVSFHKGASREKREFLWDWTAYAPGQGLVIACESEWDREQEGERRNLKHDFEKLLSAASPVKLFLCWASEELANAIKEDLQVYAANEISIFQPGSVVTLYCIDPQTSVNGNRDRVWQFQAQGNFTMSFEQIRLGPLL